MRMKVTSLLFALLLFIHSGSALRPSSLGGGTVTAAAGVRGVVATATRSPLFVLQQQELQSSRLVRTTTAVALSATAAAIRQQQRRELSRRGRNNNKNRLEFPMRQVAMAALLGISLSVAAAFAMVPPAHAASIIEAFKSKNYEQIVARPNFASSSSAVQTPTSTQQRSRRVRVLTASGVVLGTTLVGVGNLKRKQQQQTKDEEEEEEEEKQRVEAKESSPREPKDADDVDPQAVVTKKPFRLPEEMQMDNVKKEDNGDVDEASNKSRYQATLEKLIRNSQAEHSQVPRVLLSNNKRKKKQEAAEDKGDSVPSSGIRDNNDNTPAPSAAARTVDFASAKAKIAQFFPSKASNPNTNKRDDDDEKEPTTATAVLGSTQPPLTPASSVVTANIAPATTTINTATSISTTKSLAPFYSSVAQARQQPQPPAEEAKLQARYAAMDNLQDRAFQILVDLGMVELTSSAGSDDDDDEWQ